jgi:predicted dehydrogenase
VKVGIIGLGFMGATHAATYAQMQGVSIAAVSARNADVLKGDFSKVGGNLSRPLPNVDFSATAKYEDWTKMLDDAEVEAVDICLPTDLHRPVAVASLTAGKHVLCEKPMGLSEEDCDAMLEAARTHGRVLMIGHVLRFWPDYQYLRDFLRTEKYGTARRATFTRVCGLPDWSSWLPDTARSGGALLDLLVHDIDQILLLFGAPAAVRAKALGEFDAVSATLLYPNGPEVRLQGGWMASGTPFSMGFQVQATGGLLELGAGGLTLSDAQGQRQTVALPHADAYAAQLFYFQQCCDNGTSPDECPPEASADAVKLALLLKRSRELDGEQLACAL